MIILVTGGTGLVGTSLKNIIPFDQLDDWIFLSSKECNLCDREATLDLFRRLKPTYVIHLAGKVGGLFHNLVEPVSFFRDNVRMNENILEACNKYGVQKGIFCLSSCIFPAEPPEFPMTMKDLHSLPPHESNYAYAMSKRMLEMQCRMYNKEYNRQYICVVPVNMYGNNDNYHLEKSHVIPGLIHKFYLAQKNNTPLTVYGTGAPLRQFLHAEDFARILLWTLEEYEDTNSIICCNDEHSIKDIVNILRKIFDFTGEINYDTSKSDGIFRKTMSNEYLKTLLPDFHFTSLEDGLRSSVEWFRNNYPNVRK